MPMDQPHNTHITTTILLKDLESAQTMIFPSSTKIPPTATDLLPPLSTTFSQTHIRSPYTHTLHHKEENMTCTPEKFENAKTDTDTAIDMEVLQDYPSPPDHGGYPSPSTSSPTPTTVPTRPFSFTAGDDTNPIHDPESSPCAPLIPPASAQEDKPKMSIMQSINLSLEGLNIIERILLALACLTVGLLLFVLLRHFVWPLLAYAYKEHPAALFSVLGSYAVCCIQARKIVEKAEGPRDDVLAMYFIGLPFALVILIAAYTFAVWWTQIDSLLELCITSVLLFGTFTTGWVGMYKETDYEKLKSSVVYLDALRQYLLGGARDVGWEDGREDEERNVGGDICKRNSIILHHRNNASFANASTSATYAHLYNHDRHQLCAMNLPSPIYVLFFLAVVIFGYCFWFGTVLARLWYYKGDLHGDFQVFDIQPAYKRGRNVKRRAEAAGEGYGDDGGKWTAVARPILHEDDVDDPAEKRRIMEDRRISRLPTFLQDDCGDASQFPDVGYGIPAEVYNKQFEQSRPVDYRTLGLRREDMRNWLTVDIKFRDHTEAKQRLLDTKLRECVQRTPAVKEASEELLPEVVNFLTDTYPQSFSEKTIRGFPHVKNHVTRVEWSLQRPYEPQALELIARLAVEDFVFFGRDEFAGAWKLIGGSVCFPSGWSLSSILGQDIDNLLEPVVAWDNLSDILDYMEQSSDTQPMKRSTTFIQTNPGDRSNQQLLHIPARQDFFQGRISSLKPQDMVVRRERQTFRKLLQSGVIVMTVKTELCDLMDLSVTERRNLADEIHSWEENEATLKGLDLWRRIVLGFIEGRTMVYDDQTVIETW
ncbi:hypothetical protein CC80DRAFT_538383 [Byssothecium circinans]|uniref:Uncharacterized protein n=1 Tax=Byssothecium circinans TaxID=147558 RepID=A0A6A5THU2_9PLEO|nr:hypothetical protein CC80DRAFT_538383 [Byssothecium circinans]